MYKKKVHAAVQIPDSHAKTGRVRVTKMKFQLGQYSDTGAREYNEDRTMWSSSESNRTQYSFFGILDGHGGAEVAEDGNSCQLILFLVADLFPPVLIAELQNNLTPRQALRSGILFLDTLICKGQIAEKKKVPYLSSEPMPSPGASAALCAFDGSELWLANLGSCRALYGNSRGCEQLSKEHRPNDAEEAQRIRAAGHLVTVQHGTLPSGESVDVYRVDGICTVSRAFGVAELKDCDGNTPPSQYAISCVPHLKHRRPQPGDYVLLVSDGVSSVLGNARLHEIVQRGVQDFEAALDDQAAADSIAQRVVEAALRANSTNNCTAMLFLLLK
jgi:serine/threonine protein phosphatase PrpC